MSIISGSPDAFEQSGFLKLGENETSGQEWLIVANRLPLDYLMKVIGGGR